MVALARLEMTYDVVDSRNMMLVMMKMFLNQALLSLRALLRVHRQPKLLRPNQPQRLHPRPLPIYLAG